MKNAKQKLKNYLRCLLKAGEISEKDYKRVLGAGKSLSTKNLERTIKESREQFSERPKEPMMLIWSNGQIVGKKNIERFLKKRAGDNSA